MSSKNLWGEPAYYTSVESAIAIMRELNRIQFEKKALEWFEGYAVEVMKELKRQGVKFPLRNSTDSFKVD